MRDEERGEASSKRGRRVPQRILLVQPDAVLGLALSKFLAGYFPSVALAASDTAALSLLRGGLGYDVIIADDCASDETLLACFAAAHGGSLRPNRVILLSGDAPPALSSGSADAPGTVAGAPRSALRRAARYVLEKPVPGSVLLGCVDACLGPGLHKSLPRTGQMGQHLRR